VRHEQHRQAELGVVAELCNDVCVIYAGQTIEAGPTGTVLAVPKHPYTRALLACHPDRADTFIGIPGAVPSPLSPPSGCRFAPRCPEARPVCGGRPPHPIKLRAGQRVDCVLYDAPETVRA
jgi:oligopeptide/dipeptide ABC transporter ATP-binding protein